VTWAIQRGDGRACYYATAGTSAALALLTGALASPVAPHAQPRGAQGGSCSPRHPGAERGGCEQEQASRPGRQMLATSGRAVRVAMGQRWAIGHWWVLAPEGHSRLHQRQKWLCAALLQWLCVDRQAIKRMPVRTTCV
jgi:hypothetical protein